MLCIYILLDKDLTAFLTKKKHHFANTMNKKVDLAMQVQFVKLSHDDRNNYISKLVLIIFSKSLR